MYQGQNFENIPKQPGCYIFRNAHGEIIYIGKSKSLRNRVRQYFYPKESAEYNKYAELAKNVREIETIVTDTETNALILECMLIKEHKPKYNSQLKKWKVYPYICIDIQQIFPAITIIDSAPEDGRKYYGSFYNRDDALQTLELMGNIWQTPTCCKESLTGGGRPCLNYHLGKCCAPCAGMVDRELYLEKISEIIKCMNGNFSGTLSKLNREMKLASVELDFEKAAKLRDSISGLRRLQKKQKRLFTNLDNQAVYLFFRAFNEQRFSLFFLRCGEAKNRVDFPDLNEPGENFFEAFVRENKRGVVTIENGVFLTKCILDIHSSKYFVPVSDRATEPQTIKKLQKAYREFVSDGF